MPTDAVGARSHLSGSGGSVNCRADSGRPMTDCRPARCTRSAFIERDGPRLQRRDRLGERRRVDFLKGTFCGGARGRNPPPRRRRARGTRAATRSIPSPGPPVRLTGGAGAAPYGFGHRFRARHTTVTRLCGPSPSIDVASSVEWRILLSASGVNINTMDRPPRRFTSPVPRDAGLRRATARARCKAGSAARGRGIIGVSRRRQISRRRARPRAPAQTRLSTHDHARPDAAAQELAQVEPGDRGGRIRPPLHPQLPARRRQAPAGQHTRRGRRRSTDATITVGQFRRIYQQQMQAYRTLVRRQHRRAAAEAAGHRPAASCSR